VCVCVCVCVVDLLVVVVVFVIVHVVVVVFALLYSVLFLHRMFTRSMPECVWITGQRGLVSCNCEQMVVLYCVCN
jgi:hypothetical protein